MHRSTRSAWSPSQRPPSWLLLDSSLHCCCVIVVADLSEPRPSVIGRWKSYVRSSIIRAAKNATDQLLRRTHALADRRARSPAIQTQNNTPIEADQVLIPPQAVLRRSADDDSPRRNQI